MRCALTGDSESAEFQIEKIIVVVCLQRSTCGPACSGDRMRKQLTDRIAWNM